jgi:hypothetical protein
MLIDKSNLLDKTFGIFRCAMKAAVRHCFKHMQFGLDTCAP